MPDPDVAGVDILVELRALEGDEARWWTLYTTHRVFDADTLIIPLALEDHATIASLAEAQPPAGALAIPTARDVRLTLTAVGHDDPDYFDSAAARIGIPITVEVRADAIAEGPLFSPVDLPVRGFFFQPPPDDGSVASPVERLAQELGLDHSRLTISGRPGHRTVFASSAGLHHTLATELSSITFASNADLIQRWVNVLHFKIDRDWIWDGLAEAGAEVRRVVKRRNKDDLDELAGTIQLSRAVPFAAISAVPANVRAPQRQFTDVFFFDAFDPKPAPGDFPVEVTFEYRIVPAFKGDEPAPASETLPELLVPITTRPTQTPKLVSAGIALSKFVPADDYSSTEQRDRFLWLEFDAKPADGDDAYFVRVVADAPDPVLTAENIPNPAKRPCRSIRNGCGSSSLASRAIATA